MPERERIPCAVCDSLESHPVYRKFDLTVSRCARCGLVFASPRATKEEIWRRYSPAYFWDEYLPAHGVVNGQFDLAHFDAVHAPMLALLAAHAPGRGRLLEVGTGAGFFLKAAERAGWQCAGLEVSADAATFARDRLSLDVKQGSAEEISYPPGTFDAAVLLEVIEHLLDPLRSLSSVWSSLKPGGVMLLSTPNFDALSRRVLGRQWAVISPGEHLYYFTEASLAALLARAGFTGVAFQRQYPGFGLIGTMNATCTHQPDSARAKIYRGAVHLLGDRAASFVRGRGWGDTLLSVARRV
jgi:SAM-dependent methyltransferase